MYVRKRIRKPAAIVGLAIALCWAGAAAAHDRFDPQKYPKGGFAPVTNATYAKECGACHFAYLPGLLPARSWHALLEKTNSHFGESLSLSPETLRDLDAYLVANAGDKTDYDGPSQFYRYLKDETTPLRITDLPMMHRNHKVVRNVMQTNSTMKVRSLTNCQDCHTTAATGSFANRDLIVPGLTKMVGSHGLF